MPATSSTHSGPEALQYVIPDFAAALFYGMCSSSISLPDPVHTVLGLETWALTPNEITHVC
jgi:hypothetical protein